jgi:tetratricopeptide (TPR) repeat protein
LMAGGLLAASLAYLVQNQFSFGVVAITSLFWVIWGMVMVLGRAEDLTPPKAVKLSLGDVPWFLVAIVAIVSVFLIHISFRSFFGDIYFKMGKNALETRQLPQAADYFQRSLNVFPLEGTTVSHLAISYLNMGNLPEAAKYLAYGNKIDPYNADNFYMLARVNLSYFDQGNKAALEESNRYNEIALKIDPYYAEAYENRAMIAERLGKPAVALEQYETAFMVNPNLVNVINRMTDLALQLGRAPEARQRLTVMFRRYPENLDIFKALERLK